MYSAFLTVLLPYVLNGILCVILGYSNLPRRLLLNLPCSKKGSPIEFVTNLPNVSLADLHLFTTTVFDRPTSLCSFPEKIISEEKVLTESLIICWCICDS